MSTYFKIDPSAMPWPPVFEKVFIYKQFVLLNDNSCLAEAVLKDNEENLLIEAGATIIGNIDQVYAWIEDNRDLFPEQEEI